MLPSLAKMSIIESVMNGIGPPSKIAILLILSFCLMMIDARVATAQDDDAFWESDVRSKWYVPFPEIKKGMVARWDEIGRDLETETNPLAGTFAIFGDMTGYILKWSSRKGFIFIPYYDQSMISDYSYGRVEITPDMEIRLIPEKELSDGMPWMKKTPPVWIPAANGNYLVQKNEINQFSDYYGGYGKFNGFPRKSDCELCGTFAERQLTKDNPTLPRLSFIAPPKYVGAIRKPIEAQIIYVGKNRRARSNQNTVWSTREKELSSITPVLIDAGSRKGVRKGMFFLVEDGVGSKLYQVLEITRVTAGSSEGIVIRDLHDGKEMYHSHVYDDKSKEYLYLPFKPLVKGLKVTTSALGQ